MYYFRKPSYLLQRAFKRHRFPELCEQWREHPVSDGEYSDVWDGSVWRDQHAAFLAQPHSIALMLMDDNFNPNGSHARKRYSMGSICFAILNLPKHLRFRPENLLRCGLVPGPKEPPGGRRAFLRVLLQDLKAAESGVLCEGGITIRVRLVATVCDLVALWSVTRFLGHHSKCGCPFCLLVSTIICKRVREDGTEEILPGFAIGEGIVKEHSWATPEAFLGELMIMFGPLLRGVR